MVRASHEIESETGHSIDLESFLMSLRGHVGSPDRRPRGWIAIFAHSDLAFDLIIRSALAH